MKLSLLTPRLSTTEQIDLLEDLAAFVRAGLPPFDALQAIDQVLIRRKKRRQHAVLSQVLSRMRAGRTLAQALVGTFDATSVIMIDSGEKSGDLATSLREAAGLMRRKKEMVSMVVSSLTKPAINLAALTGLVYYVALQVVPAAQKLLPKEFMSDLSKAYFAFGEWFIAWAPIVVAAFAGVVAVVLVSMPWWTGSLRKRLDGIFPWSIYQYIQSGAFLLTVATMMRAGIPFGQAVNSVIPLAGGWLKEKLVFVRRWLSSGKDEAESIHRSGLLPPAIDDRLSVYARLPDFVAVMGPLSEDAMAQAKKKVGRFSSTVSTISMVLIAVFILFTVFGLGDAAMSASDAASRKTR